MIDDDNKLTVSAIKRDVKLMSKTIMNLKTPDKIKGQHINDQLRLKISHKKEKVLSLQINIDSPVYDDKGRPIYPEDEEDDYEDPHQGHFNIHLLSERHLDKQPYLGENNEWEEMDDEQREKFQAEREKNLQDEFAQKFNIDFAFDEEKLSYDDGGSINSD